MAPLQNNLIIEIQNPEISGSFVMVKLSQNLTKIFAKLSYNKTTND